jgi:4-hydroxy-4-methyl-2-oxoglutarate aldolase
MKGVYIMTKIAEIQGEILEILNKANTGMVIDALAMSGIQGGVMGVRPVRGFEDAKIIGPAATVLFAPFRPGTPKLDNYQIIRNSPPGSVMVIDGKGLDAHFTGDNQAECAKRRGMKGIVVYGGARDMAGFRQVGLPLYCMGSATRGRPGELQLAAYNVPIEIGGVRVNPGDIIVADEDGVVAIPAESLGAIMENMRIIFEVEEGMEQALKRDASLEELSAILSKKKRKA